MGNKKTSSEDRARLNRESSHGTYYPTKAAYEYLGLNPDDLIEEETESAG